VTFWTNFKKKQANFRLMIGITHSDLDGLVSAMLAGIHFGFGPEEVIFARPSDAQHGVIEIINKESVVTDLPYISGATHWYDHHMSNILGEHKNILGIRRLAPSCAGILKKEFGIKGYEKLVSETDRIDSLQLTAEEILNPYGYYLLSKLVNEDIDGEDTITFNHYLMHLMKDNGGNVRKILADPLVEGKVSEYLTMQEFARPYIKQQIQSSGDLLLVDLREAPSKVFTQCCFMYDPFVFDGGKDSAVMVRIYHPNLDSEKTRFQVFKNPLSKSNKYSDLNIGTFLRELGGGGHPYSGGVTVPTGVLDETFTKIKDYLRR
jgi:hypothetical protein